MLTTENRIEVARSAVDYLTGRDAEEMARPVPNCPGWTVNNAAVHVARVCQAWAGMMQYPPDDADARDKAYAKVDELPHGVDAAQLAAWGHAALDHMEGDDRECYFSMTGGPGTTGLWAWHAASEIGVHRLDVEAALGHDHTIALPAAIDALDYACRYFMPAMRRVTGQDPGSVVMNATDEEGMVAGAALIDSDAAASVTLTGPAVQLLLTIWGRPTSGVEVSEGDRAVLDAWRALPGEAFQFGAWD